MRIEIQHQMISDKVLFDNDNDKSFSLFKSIKESFSFDLKTKTISQGKKLLFKLKNFQEQKHPK
jgi:hypothetical protein